MAVTLIPFLAKYKESLPLPQPNSIKFLPSFLFKKLSNINLANKLGWLISLCSTL